MYYNIRDRFGKFTAKKKATKKNHKTTGRKRKRKPQFETIITSFLLDCSVSMAGKEAGVISGFNQLLKQGREDSIKTGIKTVEYMAEFSEPHRYKGHNDVVELNGYTYRVNGGSTALWQSTARIITETEEIQRKYPKSSVIVTIFTDGEENSSMEGWGDPQKLKDLIKRKQEEGWVITYVGADRTLAGARANSSKIGIFSSNTMNYANSSVGTANAINTVTASRSAYYDKSLVGTVTTDGFFAEEN